MEQILDLPQLLRLKFQHGLQIHRHIRRRRMPPNTVWPAALCLLLVLTGCRSVPHLPPVDLSASGWTVRQGQAVWRRQAHAPEIAGELLVATHADGSTFVQFAKNPLPFVTAQTTTNRWRVEFIPQHRTWAGNGEPPQKIVWLHLAPCLSGDTSASGCWHFQRLPGGNWRMENPPSGEFLEGFLNP